MGRAGDQRKRSGRYGFFHQGALGDFILFLPILDALFRSQAAGSFEIWTRPVYGALVYGKPYSCSIHSHEASFWSGLYCGEEYESSRLPRELRSVEVFFWVGQTTACELAGRLEKSLGRPVHWICSFPADREDPQPVTHFLARQFRSLGWTLEVEAPSVHVSSRWIREVQKWLEDRRLSSESYAVVHVGSGGRKKVWPLKRWTQLLVWMGSSLKLPIVFIAGPADAPFFPFVKNMSERLGGHIVAERSLEWIMALLHAARVYVGCDSGVSHLAAAVGTPSCVLFGPTDPRVWAPRGPHVHIFRDFWRDDQVMAGVDGDQETDCVDPRVFEKLTSVLSRIAGRRKRE